MQRREDEIRQKAQAKNEEGQAFLTNQNMDEAYKMFVQAINQLKEIKKTDRRSMDWQFLALYQGMASFCCRDKKDKRKWLAKAFNNYKRLPKNERLPDNWRTLAMCCNHFAALSRDPDNKSGWYKKGLKNLSKISKNNRSDEDQRLLAHFQSKLSKEMQDPEQKLLMLKKAVRTLEKIAANNREPIDWRRLAKYQCRMGQAYKKQGDWLSAWQSFQAALDAKEIDYKTITNCYKKLRRMSNNFTLDDQINVFAQEVFTNVLVASSDLKKRLYKIHFQLLQASNPDTKHLLQLLKLMRLIDQYASRQDFPNRIVTSWLSDPKEAQNFKRMLHQLEEAYQPPALAHQLAQGHSIQMGMVLEIKTLKIRINELETQNKKLVAQLEKQSSSYFETPLTVFGGSVAQQQISPSEHKKIEGNFTP